MSALTNITTTRPSKDVLEEELLNHCVCHKTSFLCASQREEDRELQVLTSTGCWVRRWYIGAVAEGSRPATRDSQYFPTQETAQEALDNRSWIQRMDP